MKAFLRRLLLEPLIQFAAIGGLIFVAFAALNEGAEPPADVIVISAERIDQIAKEYESVWRRQPSADELDSMIEEDIREEVYYREAIALGLDQNDALVRRRMRLKMEFLMDSTANAVTPAAGELEAYLAANEALYLLEERLALEQVFLGEKPSPEVITALLQQLQSDPTIEWQSYGTRTMLPAQVGLSTPGVVSGIFGKGFFEQLAEAPVRQWTGPITSNYGVHLIRILDALPARVPQLDEVRDEVSRDWKGAKAGEFHDRDYSERRGHFVIEIQRPEAKLEQSE